MLEGKNICTESLLNQARRYRTAAAGFKYTRVQLYTTYVEWTAENRLESMTFSDFDYFIKVAGATYDIPTDSYQL